MKKLFFLGAVFLMLFEATNVYFIMPLPYSQRMRSIDVAYTLYTWRWAFRVVFLALILSTDVIRTMMAARTTASRSAGTIAAARR